MQNKLNVHIYNIIFLFAGLLIGFFVWHHTPTTALLSNNNSHMMPNGTMMGGYNYDTTTSDMGDMMNAMNASLTGKTGDAFDQAFLSEMIVHHQGAIDMAKLALTNAKHQEIKDLANAIIKAQTSEIAQMKAWQKSWYNQ